MGTVDDAGDQDIVPDLDSAERNIPVEKLQNHPPEIKSHFQKNRERKEQQKLQKMRQKLKEMYNQKKK